MSTVYYTQDYIDADGQKFRVEHHYDEYSDVPWNNSTCHGGVSEWTNRKKKPGELILYADRYGYRRYYDFQGTIKRAKSEDWDNASSIKCPKERGEAIKNLVMADYQFLRDWCNDEWHYIGIVAFPLTGDGDELRSKKQSVWEIESFADSSHIQEHTEYLLREAGANGQVEEWEG